MEDLKSIFKEIKATFCNLWQFKERGNTLEIITPYSTITNKFISIFITRRGDEIVISDGGWVATGFYETEVNTEEEYFEKLFSTYETYYEIQKIIEKSIPYFFKKTSNPTAIPIYLFDIVQFIQGVVGGSIVEFEDPKEKAEKENFKKEANLYIGRFASKESIKINSPLSDDLKSVKFNAIITKRKSKLTLLNYITGSSPSFFIGSIGKANLNFEIATESDFVNFIDNKIAIINDTASGFQEEKLYKYLEKMERNSSTKNIKWTERHLLDEYLV